MHAQRTMTLRMLLFVTALSLYPGIVSAQGGVPASELSADSIVRLFDWELRETGRSSVGRGYALMILSDGSASGARRDSVARGLQRLAETADAMEVRTGAASYLVLGGGRAHQHPYPSAARQVVAIFRRNDNPLFRAVILGQIHEMADEATIIPFLQEVARQPSDLPPNLPHVDQPDVPTQAVLALARMGDRGQAAVRALHAAGGLRSEMARGMVADLAHRERTQP